MLSGTNFSLRRGAIFLIACAALLGTAFTQTSSAFTFMPADIPPREVPTNYQGSGYIAHTAANISGFDPTPLPENGWRWTSTGWQAATLPIGTGVQVYPFGSGWMWAYRSGTWYAFQRAQLAQWSCTGPAQWTSLPGPNTDSMMLGGTGGTLRKYNTEYSPSLGEVKGGARVYAYCTNTIGEASFPTTTPLVVYVPYDGCAQAPGDPICMPTSVPDRSVCPRVSGVDPEPCHQARDPWVLVYAMASGVYQKGYLHYRVFDPIVHCCPPVAPGGME